MLARLNVRPAALGAIVLSTLLVAGSPGALVAQEEGTGTVPSQDSLRTLVNEFQQLQARIGELQDSAIQVEPGLQAQRDAVQELVEETMLEEDPQVEQAMERLPEIQQAIQEAQAAQDTAGMRDLVMEGQQLSQRLQQAQAAAMETEEVQVVIQDFQDDLLAAMEEIDPEVSAMLDRMQALGERLQALQMQMGG